ncbi:MAG: hypothetical protein NTX44_07675 [Ignavibacteriales bacterium]|nr:hypothetical protein [Ignavibacteriales bacterium]
MMPIHGRSGNLIAQVIPCVVWILVLSFSATYALSAQEQSKMEVRDTLVKKPLINQSLLRSFDADILLPSSLRDVPEYVPLSLHQSITSLPTSLSGQFQQQIDVVSPWKQELAKQNEFRMLKTLLGAVQAGGTAYLLYEHIRKFGLK